ELLAEEERAKRKAEKKKLKKKKQKDRKKREKLGQEQKSKQDAELVAVTSSLALSFQSTPAAGPGHPQSSSAEERRSWPDPSPSPGPEGSSGEEVGGQGSKAEELEDELDLSCTFVSKARQKAGVRLLVPGKEKPARTGSTELAKRVPEKVPKAESLDTCTVEQSLILAGHGNEAAQQGRYSEAVQAFTEAVKLNPWEHRLFGNRSYCYEKLGRYEEALRDAQESLRLQPGWPKGFFRKGKALRGLQVLGLGKGLWKTRGESPCPHPHWKPRSHRCLPLVKDSTSPGTLQPPPTPQPRVVPAVVVAEPILPSTGAQASKTCRDTDKSGFVTIVNSRSHGQPAVSSPQTLPLTHPARDCYPLWVGNVTSRITEKVLQGAFGRFGEIRFIRLLPGRRCAFVNYTRKKAAEAAYAAMQDTKLEGSRLVLQLKHPSHATPSPRWHP
ncbi:TTC31 protein, partial [Galbula dea]|nr:TTC31 protein [Galbula dea]